MPDGEGDVVRQGLDRPGHHRRAEAEVLQDGLDVNGSTGRAVVAELEVTNQDRRKDFGESGKGKMIKGREC